MINEEELKSQYFNPALPGSFSGSETFLRALKRQKLKHNPNIVREWLKNEETYTLHKPLRHKFKRNRVIVSGIDDTWQCDLVDMQSDARINDRNRYILTCIDVFSKFAWAIPVRTKSAPDIVNAFRIILESNRKPKNLQTDKGTEFFNKDFKKLMTDYNINLYAVESEMKACVIERFNRTLKEKMYRYFTYKLNHRYIDDLENLINAYNNTYHRTIKMAPIQVNKTIEKDLWKRMYGYDDNYMNNEKIKFRFNIGDHVRISKKKNTFEKGFTPNWTREIFVITERLPRFPPVYKLKDLMDEPLKGILYEPDLQKVYNHDLAFKINKVLRKRTKNGRIENLVSWLGYPDKFNSWVDANDIIDL